MGVSCERVHFRGSVSKSGPTTSEAPQSLAAVKPPCRRHLISGIAISTADPSGKKRAKYPYCHHHHHLQSLYSSFAFLNERCVPPTRFQWQTRARLPTTTTADNSTTTTITTFRRMDSHRNSKDTASNRNTRLLRRSTDSNMRRIQITRRTARRTLTQRSSSTSQNTTICGPPYCLS